MNWTQEEYDEYLQRNGKIENPKPKKSKYNAQKTRNDGICFDSKLESKFYDTLKLLQRTGNIKGFCRQPRFVIIYGDEKVNGTEYVADFVIFENDGTARIVDVKGVETKEFQLKMKAFREKYPGLTVELEE